MMTTAPIAAIAARPEVIKATKATPMAESPRVGRTDEVGGVMSPCWATAGQDHREAGPPYVDGRAGPPGR